MIAEIAETTMGAQTSETHVHWDIIEVWDSGTYPHESDRDDQIETGVDVAWYDQSALGADANTVIPPKTNPTVVWDNQRDSDAIGIDAQTDVESDMFWDALSNPDTDMEDDVLWDALTNPDTNLKVIIQTNIEDKASWNVPTNVNKDAGVDIQLNDDIFWDLQTKAFIDNQPERRTDEPVLIQSASSNNFLTIWNESNNIKFIDTQSALEKVNS